MTTQFQIQINRVPLHRTVITGLFITGLLIASAANATPFKLSPINLGNGYSLSGKVYTDDTNGALKKKNIKRWNITLTSKKVIKRYTTANTNMITTSGLSTDSDSETLTIASEFGYLTAQANSPDGNIFDIVPLDFGDGLIVSGRITTDGTTGSLAASNLINWNIVVKKITKTTLTRKNSKLLFAKEVTADNQTLEIDRTGGKLGFGSSSSDGLKGSRNILADFTNPNTPEGRAGYIDSSIRQILKPLGDPSLETYKAGTVIPTPGDKTTENLPMAQPPAPVPEPATLALFGIGLSALASLRPLKRKAA